MEQPVVTLPRKVRTRTILIEAISIVLLMIWLYTGISKLLQHGSFYLQMQQSPIFGSYALLVSYGAPVLEIILAVLLIFPKTRAWGMAGSFVLMLFFVWYVAWLMIKLPNLPCSCGGIIALLDWPQHLVLNIFLCLCALAGVLLLRKARHA